MTDFHGRNILVTGGSGGIGGTTVRHLVKANANVIAAGRSQEALAAIARETGCRTVTFDLASEEEIRDALEGLDLWGVVNCGGFGGEIATPMDTDIAIFDKVITVNARGVLLVTKYATRQMVAIGKGGAIVNVSSQAALENITRCSALELGKYNIRVNSVNPTVVMTPISSGHWSQPHVAEPFLKQMPLGRWATEDEVAGPIVFLLSDAASMITGIHLPIDGGYTCR